MGDKLQSAFSSYLMLLTSVWVSIQVAGPEKSHQLYPPDNDLVAAAEHGYRSEQNIEFVETYVHVRQNRNYDCLPITQTIGVAGPLTLAAMQGRAAHLKTMSAPSIAELLHVKGALMLRLVSYAAKKDDRAEIWLVQGTQQIHPSSEKLQAGESEACHFGTLDPSGVRHADRATWKVSQVYVFQFQPETSEPDWNKPLKLFVRKNGHEENYEITVGRILDLEAKSVL